MKDKFEELEKRVSKLEKDKSPCKLGHDYQQAQGQYSKSLFCKKCGSTITLGQSEKVGF